MSVKQAYITTMKCVLTPKPTHFCMHAVIGEMTCPSLQHLCVLTSFSFHSNATISQRVSIFNIIIMMGSMSISRTSIPQMMQSWLRQYPDCDYPEWNTCWSRAPEGCIPDCPPEGDGYDPFGKMTFGRSTRLGLVHSGNMHSGKRQSVLVYYAISFQLKIAITKHVGELNQPNG